MKSEAEIRAHILTFVSACAPRPTGHRAIGDDFDIRLDGGMDSLGFLRLIADIEARTGRTIDLADIDPEKLTRLGVLAAHISGQIATS
jgi:acyl carrier protein